MNAIDFLVKEHEKVRQLLDEISDANHQFATKQKKFQTLCDDLLRHEEMEHKIWYPHFKNDSRLDDTVKHLLTEEKGAERAIKHFDKVEDQSEWETKFAKFKKDVQHHASEEERDLFPMVKEILSEKELEEIGHEMYQFKQEYKQNH